jgi:hypothetical protein
MAGFDVETAIVEFLADYSRSTLQLPHMTTGQRKHAKKVADQHPELACVSYGFGQERQLHLFKKGQSTTGTAVAKVEDNVTVACVKDELLDRESQPVSVKNTFIDDWVADMGDDTAAEPVVFRSMPPRLPKCLLPSIKEAMCEEGASPDRSTVASSSGSSIEGSPRSTNEPEPLVPSFVVPPPPGLEVRNTFIHFEDGRAADERIIQSMPHDMFRQCLSAEVVRSEGNEKRNPTAEAGSRPVPLALDIAVQPGNGAPAMINRLMPGTEVVIEGLSKLPAFNGLKGTVQCMDEESGRYNILLFCPVGAHKFAKVKAENLLIVMPPPPPCFAPTFPLEECRSPAWEERSSVPRALTLTALV